MDLALFGNEKFGDLVPISGVDPRAGEWSHRAFVPRPLGDRAPALSPETHLVVADARAAIAALGATAEQLPNPQLFRQPSLRREAQATSALEGTYEPLQSVLVADEAKPVSASMREVLNFVSIAAEAFAWVDRRGSARPLTVGLLADLMTTLMAGTPAATTVHGGVREKDVVVGRRTDAPLGSAPVHAARYVPPPPGVGLEARLRDLTDWMNARHPAIDPVVAAAMAHYEFEALHTFEDGNGRIGRLLIVVQLYLSGALNEPTLTVSPWFEARRHEYYDRLFEVSSEGRWDAWVAFFAEGLRASATDTQRHMVALVGVQAALKQRIRESSLRAQSALDLVDLAVGRTAFTVSQVQLALSLSVARTSTLVADLVKLGVLESVDDRVYNRVFYAPEVLRVLTMTERL